MQFLQNQIKQLLTLIIALIGLILSPSISCAQTYYVATTGSNSNNCTAAQTITTPKQTLASALACLTAAGSTLMIRGGSFTENISSTQITVSGTSYANAVTIQAYPGEAVTLNGNITLSTPSTGVTRQYWIFKEIIVRGVAYIGGGGAGGTINNIKFDGLTVGGASSGAKIDDYRVVQIGGDDGAGTDSWITNSIMQHCAYTGTVNGCHGVYVQTNNNIVENSEINNTDGYGIHNYGSGGNNPSNNVYRSNYIHNCGAKVNQTNFGVGIAAGTNNLIYNNVIVNNQEGIDLPQAGNFAYNNTLFGNGVGYGGACCYAALRLTTVSTARNNISYGNQIDTPENSGGGTVSNTVTTNPNFVNTAGGVTGFMLQSTSTAAIDTGTSIAGTFTTDYSGGARPQGTAWDVGAFEFMHPRRVRPLYLQ